MSFHPGIPLPEHPKQIRNPQPALVIRLVSPSLLHGSSILQSSLCLHLSVTTIPLSLSFSLMTCCTDRSTDTDKLDYALFLLVSLSPPTQSFSVPHQFMILFLSRRHKGPHTNRSISKPPKTVSTQPQKTGN